MESIDLTLHYPSLKGGRLTPFILTSLYDGDDPFWIRPAVVVLPGGAHAFCSNREREPVAAKFLAKGYQVFILDYMTSTQGAHYPEQFLEAGCAVDFIKEHASDDHVNREEIFVIGFSAGGHLAANLTCCYGDLSSFGLEIDASFTALGLGYPVINHHLGYDETHRNLLGEDFEEKADDLDLDSLVKEGHVPTYIMATSNDNYVPSQNALAYAKALSDHHVFYFFAYVSQRGTWLRHRRLRRCPLPKLYQESLQRFFLDR